MTNTNSDSAKPSAKKPVFRKQLPGGISAAVFENTREGKIYRSVNLQRSYRHNGKWNRMSIFLDHQDIPFMVEVLNGVWRYLNEFPASSAADAEDDASAASDQSEAAGSLAHA